jgi:gamma-glutamyltranspeptidase/glutathione hydrolase
MTRSLKAILVMCAVVVVAPAAQTDPDVSSRAGMVVCTSAPACDAGAAILARGGNAVDAAVATAFAMAVTYPSAGNIGGGGFMIVRAANGSATAFDYRERAPLKSTRTMYLRDGRIDISLTNFGYLAPGVPGTVRGLARAHKKFGTLPWKDVVMPAVGLAENGFTISEALARSLNNQLSDVMGRFPASVAAYGKPDRGLWERGDRLVLKDLGKTLSAIAIEGPDVFYKGWIADRIAEDMAANGGLITKEDLARYEAKERTPVRGSYGPFEIVSMPPPSSGGVALIEMLNILEPFHLKAKGRYSSESLHLQIEAMRRAYLDRARYLGDPDFAKVQVDTLISKEHARALSASIDAAQATKSVDLGKDLLATPPSAEPDETTHFSVIDRNGMAVSNTYTLEGGFGSRVVVKGAGFLLNNEMGDFNKNPGVTDVTGTIGTPANLIDPGKRMLSSMTPTMVIRDGKVVLITGSPGGRTIINTVLSVVLGVTEFGLNVRDAVDAPRVHHQWLPDTVQIEKNGASDEVLEQVRAMGHVVTVGGAQGDANSIMIDGSGVAWGANDRRNADGKASAAGGAATTAAVKRSAPESK